MILIKGKVMDASMQHLQGVKVSELNFGGVLQFNTTTDENGDFSLMATSPESTLKFERDYYKPVLISAKDFFSYITLDKAVIELNDDQTKKPKGVPAWIMVLLALGIATAIGGYIYYNDPRSGKPVRIKTTI
jgi:hypothetical protein